MAIGTRLRPHFLAHAGCRHEYATAFAGSSLPTRAALLNVCAPFPFLQVDRCIEHTLDALTG